MTLHEDNFFFFFDLYPLSAKSREALPARMRHAESHTQGGAINFSQAFQYTSTHASFPSRDDEDIYYHSISRISCRVC